MLYIPYLISAIKGSITFWDKKEVLAWEIRLNLFNKVKSCISVK